MLKVFVYGTLKPGEANYQKYCAGKVVEAKRAMATGKLYVLPAGYPAMIQGDGKVHGYLLSFADSAPLAALDALEDYQPHQTSKNLYNRHYIEVYELNGSSLSWAWAYFMTSDKIYWLRDILLDG